MELINQIAKAIQNPRWVKWNGIKLPSPQGAGTQTQKDSYALLKASKFIKEYNITN